VIFFLKRASVALNICHQTQEPIKRPPPKTQGDNKLLDRSSTPKEAHKAETPITVRGEVKVKVKVVIKSLKQAGHLTGTFSTFSSKCSLRVFTPR
jgi:hypothetical protein